MISGGNRDVRGRDLILMNLWYRWAPGNWATAQTVLAPEGRFTVRWKSASHETRSYRRAQCDLPVQ